MRIPALIFALLLAPALAFAHSTQSGDIAVGHIWAYPAQTPAEQSGFDMGHMPKGNTVDIFGPIVNGGASSDAFTGITASGIGGANIVHWIRGQQMVQGFPVPLDPDKPVAFAPQTQFIRLYGVSASAHAGDHFPITLHFRNAPEATIEVIVQAR